jgi:dTDP-4-amino-4,6-dideoxy-D-galactose acyltransferase
MGATVQLLAWDSQLFGFGVARLTGEGLTAAEAAAALAECRAAGVRLVYWPTRPTDAATNRAAQQHGAWLADRKVTFAMPLPSHLAAAPADAGIVATTNHTPQLESLAWQSGAYSRFARDPRLPVAAFRQLYTQWLRNSLNGTIAQVVLTLPDAAGHELGLLTLGEKNGWADIGLLAVDEPVRGQRVGQRLVAEARRRAAGAGVAGLQVVTQRDNARACRFYESCGFALAHEEYIYHLWLT